MVVALIGVSEAMENGCRLYCDSCRVAIVDYMHQKLALTALFRRAVDKKASPSFKDCLVQRSFKFSWALLLGNKSLSSLKLGPWRVYFMSSTLNYFHSSRTLTK